MNNIQQISDAYLCSACGACSVVCPKDAIDFSWSNIGRKYAVVNNNCIDCGLCRKVCPSLDNYGLTSDMADKYVGEIRGVYIGHSTDPFIYQNAQSGGVCTALLTYLFEEGKIDGAVVCRMDYGRVPTVRGVLLTSVSELLQTQKSCYTPVDLLSALKTGENCKSLAIVGLPCHIEAVENLKRTNKSFGNISYQIGLICDRTLAGGIQDYICTPSPSNKLILIYWRGKGYSFDNNGVRYKKAPIVIRGKDNSICLIPRHVRICLKDMFTLPRCRVCSDKLNVFSDITLGDPWGMSGVDWENGDNLIITRTEKGERLLNETLSKRKICMKPANREEMLRGQVIEKRRESVKRYSQAYRMLPIAIPSPILQDYSGKVGTEREEMLSFINLEKQTKETIRVQASRIVREYERNQKLPYKVWHKAKKLITRLLQK